MPRGDGTGPNGMGPMTGRGMGYCAGYTAPGFMAGGFGMAMGRGRGFRRMFCRTGAPGWARFGAAPYGDAPYPGPYATNEKEILQNQVNMLEKQLSDMKEHLAGLKEKE